MVEKKKRKSNVEGGKKLLKFSKGRERRFGLFIKKMIFFSFSFSFLKAIATCPILSGAKGPTFFFDLTSYLATKEKKNWTFLDAEILPRFACRLSGSSSLHFSAPVGARFRK